ncbi:MAG: SRPBCC family protein [Myxococcota bacterium]|jgi:ribosome-associated toxin RatA of RatAB toxin-antitoxin module|nr:SRPBCC family protein [Myxococcota bacterium]
MSLPLLSKHRSKVALCSLFCLSLGLTARSADAHRTQRLEAGDVIVRSTSIKGSSAPGLKAQALVNATPERIWAVIADCDRYEQTFDRVVSAKLISRRGAYHVCEIVYDMPFPYDDLRSRTRAKHREGAGLYSRSWELLEGDYKHYRGSWKIEPYSEDPSRTLVTYDVHIVPEISVPDWLERKVRERGPVQMMERLRREVR